MNKLKSFLLPLALVFGAIAVFEFGVRYGASNTRALAVAAQISSLTGLYQPVRPYADSASKQQLAAAVDNHIMTGALIRNAWYLKLRAEPKQTLDAALARALALRGDAVLTRLEAMQSASGDGPPPLSTAQYANIRTALTLAQNELVKPAAASAPVEEATAAAAE